VNLNDSTAKMLWYGGITGIALIVAGLIFAATGFGDSVLWVGVLVLIASPMAGVAVSMTILFLEKDYKWAAVAMLLIVLSAAGAAVSWFIG
jgi:uncharacterized membrane protein